ncbi:MAG: hypothetical protein HFH38_05910 [Lachnospiraceae bacterium]|nr:hypothetical protein [Lachnospiraceae bacterium]
MKSRLPGTRRILTWLLAVSLVIGNLAQGMDVRAEHAGRAEDAGKMVYYVNCGGTGLPEGEAYGEYNQGTVDQPYDAAGEGAYHWGYDGGYEYETDTYAGHSVRLVKGNDAAPLSYSFELPQGEYQLEIGVPHCSYWGNRTMDIGLQVGGGEQENLISGLNTTDDIAEGTLKVVTSEFSVEGEKEAVAVSAIRSSEDHWAPFLGYIKIYEREEGQPAPPQESYVAYFVNCGGTGIPGGESYGRYNGNVADQPYDAAGEGGYRWGYDSGYEYETDTYVGHEVRLVKGNDAAPLSYYFELPQGDYKIEVRLPHCYQWGNRVMNVDVKVGEGKKQNLVSGLNTTEDIPDGSLRAIASEFSIKGEKEVVEVSAIRSSSQNWAPFLGYIKIYVDKEDSLAKALGHAAAIYEAGNQEGIYTEETWNAFAEAYEKALALLESADQAAREEAAGELSLAQQGLKKAKAEKWVYDFEEGIGDASLVVNRNGVSAYSGQAVYKEGRKGGRALQTGNYGLCLNKKDLGEQYTVNVWVKPSVPIPNNTPTVFLGYNSPEKWLGIAGNNSSSGCKIWTKANGAYNTLPQTVKAPAGEWVMHTIQSDGNVTAVYENGVMVAQSDSIADVLSGRNQDIYLCVNFWDGHLRGLIDDVSVYEECLTAEEVYRLYEPRGEEEIFQEEGFAASKKKSIVSGSSKQIQVTLPQGVRNAEITYSSDNTAVAQVSQDGKVAGKAPGKATVTTAVKVGSTTKRQDTAITVRSTDEIVDSKILYFVDCGNGDTSLAGDSLFGQYNRRPDQELGVDAVTGKSWGWGKIGSNDPEPGTNSRADEDSKEATYQAAGPSSDFYYEFELPADMYQVEITVPYFLSGSNTRTFEVLASNGALGAKYETVANNINTKYISGAAKTYTGTCIADGTKPLRLSFLSDSDAWGPIVSAIQISAVPAEDAKESLKAAIEKAKAYQLEDYSNGSYGALAAAIQDAEAKLDAISNAKEAKELEDAIWAAIKNLQPGVNKEIQALKALIAQAKGYKEADYTAASYQALQKAIQEAEEQVPAVTSISQAMRLANRIRQAMGALEKKPPVVNPPVTVTYRVTFDSAGGSAVAAKTVKSGQKVSKPKNPTRAKYVFAGWYAGSKKYDFKKPVAANLKLKAKWTKVKVGATKITQMQNKKASQCLVKAKKVSGAAGYQFAYSTDSRFKKSVKHASSKAEKTVLKKLKKGKVYYIKARAYKLDSKGQKVYGAYSGKKKIRIKK